MSEPSRAASPGALESTGGAPSAALLACFAGRKRAAKARHSLESDLRSSGNVALDTTVLQIDDDHNASVYDPHRVVAGALTAALTWGLFGFVSGGVPSLVASAVLGGVYGGWAGYKHGEHLTGRQLARLGRELPASSSALLTFAESSNVRAVLTAAEQQAPSTASVASIAPDLRASVLYGLAEDTVESPPASIDRTPRLHMVLIRYPDVTAARRVASSIAADRTANAPQVELVVETGASGGRRVVDPKLGARAVAHYSARVWGLFGVFAGALAGLTGGDGLLGVLEGGVVTGIVWALFGLGAGALYGLWAGRTISARRVRGIASLLPPGTSTLLAWIDVPPGHDLDDTLEATDGAQRLVLTFRVDEQGAVLEAT